MTRRNGTVFHVAVANYEHVRNFFNLTFANLFTDFFVASVNSYAEAFHFQVFSQSFAVIYSAFGYRQEAYLFRSHPGGQSACIFFDKQCQSTFIAAHGSTVDDIRQYFFVVFVDVVHTEFFSKKHIDLDGYDGIFFAEYVFNLDVQFRTIESSFVNANFVVDAEVIKQFFHYALSVFPLFCGAFVFSSVSRIPLGETEGAVFFQAQGFQAVVSKFNATTEFFCQLVRTNNQVTFGNSELTNTNQAVHFAGVFVTEQGGGFA